MCSAALCAKSELDERTVAAITTARMFMRRLQQKVEAARQKPARVPTIELPRNPVNARTSADRTKTRRRKAGSRRVARAGHGVRRGTRTRLPDVRVSHGLFSQGSRSLGDGRADGR